MLGYSSTIDIIFHNSIVSMVLPPILDSLVLAAIFASNKDLIAAGKSGAGSRETNY